MKQESPNNYTELTSENPGITKAIEVSKGSVNQHQWFEEWGKKSMTLIYSRHIWRCFPELHVWVIAYIGVSHHFQQWLDIS